MRFKEGVVVSTKMNKTVKVVIERLKAHPKYKKRFKVLTKLYAHNENPDIKVGDKVIVVETRPTSKLKRWKVISEKEREQLGKENNTKEAGKLVLNLKEYTIAYKQRKKKVRKPEAEAKAAEAPKAEEAPAAPAETPPTS